MLRPVALLALLSLPAPAVETIRILVDERDGAVTLQGEHLSAGEDREESPFQPLERRQVTVRRGASGRLELDGAPAPFESLRFRTSSGEPITAGELTVRGDVVARLRGAKLQLINVLPLETYLQAVLGSEMPRDFPPEALKAQAVASRTYALWKKLESYGAPENMGSSVIHQVYAGLEREDPRTRAAVQATAGQVLTFELRPIEAYFHSSCGGHTESGLAALGRDLPYLAEVDCPCGALPASRWALSLPLPELRKALPGASVLDVVSRTRTGRARMVRVAPDRVLDAVTVRQRLGYTRLKSLDFSVEGEAAGALQISGKGYGHGAGLCQWGAKAYADQGWDYQAILRHYYPGTELQPLY
ncbi:MAG TPA: SpoIID/LytB domain-containing protein [Myxococcales bacterium]|nr:SpoIID/LytB domain-containing protein [Myxococcales bacterium]